MAGETVLVTGGTGFIGAHCILQLLQQGYNVRTTVRSLKREADVRAIYDAVPTWGPHPDVVEGLAVIADKIPLVIMSNAMDHQLVHNVEKLQVPFHRVYTAQQAKAYKPRHRAFEYMIESLGAKPEDFLHVSSSMRYDLMPANDLGIKNKVFVNRGHEPGTPFYGYSEINDIGGLAALVGL